jgi:hypothetical protein
MNNGKELGQLAEQMFAVEVLRRGGVPCKPLGDSCRYDWVIIVGRKITRVQVKSSWMYVLGRGGRRNINRVRIGTSGGCKKKLTYKAKDVDVLAIWIDPFNSWFIRPISFIRKRLSLCIQKKNLSTAGWEFLGLA